jgi:hypothetical protein
LLVGQAVVATVVLRGRAPRHMAVPWLVWLDRFAIACLGAAWAGRLMWTVS